MRRALLAPLSLVLALTAPGCGSDDGGEPAATTVTTTAPETIPEPPEPDRTEARTRLVLAPVQSSGGCPPDVEVPATEPAAGDEADDAEPAADDEADGAVPTAADSPFPTADGAFCYWIGEPVANGNDLFDATLSQTSEEEWQVYTRVKPESTDTLNGLFDACFVADPSCPPGGGAHGATAIIWEGIVLHAPAIAVEGLADGPLSLGGGLTERRARDLVTLINR